MFMHYLGIFCTICSPFLVFISGYMLGQSKSDRKLNDLMFDYERLNSKLSLELISIERRTQST